MADPILRQRVDGRQVDRQDAALEFDDVGPAPFRECQSCGCTDEVACEGGCAWVEPDLCSRCAGGA